MDARVRSNNKISYQSKMFYLKLFNDYIITPYIKWMQKWPEMIVLNDLQIHWTNEMEVLFIFNGSREPEIMYQTSNDTITVAEMKILVRDHLSSQARITVGALINSY